MYNHQQANLHDAILMILSDLCALEQNMEKANTADLQRQIRRVANELSDFLPEIEAYGELEEKIARMEKRIRILGLQRGEDFEQ